MEIVPDEEIESPAEQEEALAEPPLDEDFESVPEPEATEPEAVEESPSEQDEEGVVEEESARLRDAD
jgi:hypothetical protein